MLRPLIASIAIAAFCGTAFGQITVEDPWVRATVPQQKSSGAFMQLSSPTAVRVVDVRSDVASIVEIHEMKMDGNVMRMGAVSGLDIPAGQTVELKPGGYHVMLMGLKRQLKDGDTVPITLVVEGKDNTRTTVEVNAPVRPLGATGPAPAHKH